MVKDSYWTEGQYKRGKVIVTHGGIRNLKNPSLTTSPTSPTLSVSDRAHPTFQILHSNVLSQFAR